MEDDDSDVLSISKDELLYFIMLEASSIDDSLPPLFQFAGRKMAIKPCVT